MLKFFRLVRQQLLKENKFSSYLLYAIGEILLVVIGILLALQINNWNQNRKFKNSQQETLHQLKSEITAQLEEITFDLWLEKRSIKSTFLILDCLANLKTVPDTMGWHFYLLTNENHTYIRRSIYESMKSKELELLSEDSLRLQIQGLYDGLFPRLAPESSYFPDIREYTDDYFRKNFKSIHGRRKPIDDLPSYLEEKWENRSLGSSWNFQAYFPRNFKQLKKDEEFKYLVNNTLKFRSHKVVRLQEAKDLSELILKRIEEYLNS